MNVDDQLRELIVKKREAMGLSQAQLAELATTNQQTVQRIEAGRVKFSRTIPGILRALGIKPTVAGAPNSLKISSDPIPMAELMGEVDLPVFGAAEGGGGVMIVSSDPVQRVRRPDELLSVGDAYGLFVVGNSMEPAYWHGDIVLVHPHKPTRPNDDVVLYGRDGAGNEVAIVKHLRKATVAHWHLTQWNPMDGELREYTLDRDTWQTAHVIVGRLARR